MDIKDVRTGMPVLDNFFGTKGIVNSSRKLESYDKRVHWYVQVVWRSGHQNYVRVDYIIPYRGKPKTI